MIIRIKSKRDGYHRCGVAHPKVATQHPAERFTDAELERLQADPVLTVELLDGELVEPGSAGGSADAGKDAKPVPDKPAKAPAAKAVKAGGSAKPAAKKATKPTAKPATKPEQAAAAASEPDAKEEEQQEEKQQSGSEE